MKRASSLLVIAAFLSWTAALQAQGSRQIKVVVNFTQSGTQGERALGASGGVVVTRRGVRPDGRFAAEERRTTVQRSAGVFTLVQDGGTSSLLVATKVPYTEVAYYQNYLTGAGYLASRVIFQEVGTALKVEADILPGDRVRVRLMPRLSYFSAEGAGLIDVTEAAAEVIVPSGRPVFLGGATTGMHEVTRRLLGYDERQGQSESSISVTAIIQ